MTRQKIFTLSEARALLPEIRLRLTLLQKLWEEIAPFREEALRLSKRLDEGGGMMNKAGEYLRISKNLARQMAYFQKAGIEIKDIATGLVDFPSIRDGRIVYLCWRMNEENITHWHETDAGFAGRQPLEKGGGFG